MNRRDFLNIAVATPMLGIASSKDTQDVSQIEDRKYPEYHVSHLIDRSYFAKEDIDAVTRAFYGAGIQENAIRFTFHQRVDLTSEPWNLYGRAFKT